MKALMFAIHLYVTLFTNHALCLWKGLMLFEEIISVYSENNTKLIVHSMGRKQSASILKQVAYIVGITVLS